MDFQKKKTKPFLNASDITPQCTPRDHRNKKEIEKEREMRGMVTITGGGGCGGNVKGSKDAAAAVGENHHQLQQQLSLVSILLAALRKSMPLSCTLDKQDEVISTVHSMEIGWPTNVQHITHVTFDRFQGFLGLPVEFEVEIPRRVPSASVSVFGVSAESMQCSFDKRGNSVPNILLLMQECLYAQGGLQAEGIFRINPENSHEEHVRDQLNRGIVPDDIDVHYLAGLIKAWFRELPSGVLDGLSPEQVLQCNTEEEFVELVKQLKPMESALLHWAIDLMADVVEHEESNKMNARNIAMVFAPNMTQMSDPLTALMHAIQVMNLLKTLIVKTLREREETAAGDYSPMSLRSSARQIDDEFDKETDTSCESAGPVTDDEDQTNYTHSCEDQDEVESLSDTEGRFFRQLDENEDARNDVRKKLEGILCKDHVCPGNGPVFIGEPCITLPDSDASSDLSTSDEEDLQENPVTTRLEVGVLCVPEVRESTNNMDKTDNKGESLSTR